MAQDWSRSRSFHLYYHGDRNLLLAELVAPLVGSLLAGGAIDRFFFIRYELGGPHVRLRLRVAPGAAGTVEKAVERDAAAFFARSPSLRPQDPGLVLRRTREILAADPGETDATLYPDNSLRTVPFVPEVDRYGGPELAGVSLDFFALSSLRALGFARAAAGEPRSRLLTRILRILAEQALGSARDETELLELLGYAVAAAGPALASFADRGDRAFEQQPDSLRELLLDVLATATQECLLEEARRLAAGVDCAAPGVSAGILKSQMHMTANRLGLHNAEEVYLGRMLWRAAQEDGGLVPALRSAWRPAPRGPLDAGRRLDHLLPAAFTTLMVEGRSAVCP